MTVLISGVVTDERGGGVAGVVVSNGEDVVKTDRVGRYELLADPAAHSFVFVTVPDGYRPGRGFYRRVPSGPSTIDFALARGEARDGRQVSFAQISDTHLVVQDENRPAGQALPTREVLVNDLRQLEREAAPDLVLATGDLTQRGSLDELTVFREAIESIDTPVIPVFGGHDGSDELARNSRQTSTRNYEKVLGPVWYSFDWGGRHFVIYASQDEHFSDLDRLRKERWLHRDLALQPVDKEIVVVQHSPHVEDGHHLRPGEPGLLEQLAAYNVKLALHGHSHSSKVFSHNGVTVASVPSFCFGGIDASPRGYRIVRFADEGFESEMRALGHDSNRTRTVPRSNDGEAAEVVWERQLPANLHRAAPVLFGDRLLLGVQDDGGGEYAGLYCVSAQTGEIDWGYVTDSSVRNSVVTDSAGRCVGVSIAGRLHCLDANTGTVRWQIEMPGFPGRWIQTSPVVGENAVYAGAKSGYGAYDLGSGEQRWYTPLDRRDYWTCYASPQLFDDLCVVLVPGRGLLGLAHDDGAVKWEQALDVGYYHAAPIVAGDRIVTGGGRGKLAVLDAPTGEIIWHRSVLDSPYASGLAVEGELIYATTPGGRVLCLDLSSGDLLWSFRSGPDLLDMSPYQRGGRSLLAPPVVDRGRVIVGGLDAQLSVLDAESGELTGWVRLDGPITAAPCVVEDGFVVGTWDGKLYRLEE